MESSADARGPVTRPIQDATEKTRIVLSLPHRGNAPADPPIMALGGRFPQGDPPRGRPPAGLDRSAAKRPRKSVSAPGGMSLMSHQRECYYDAK
jgi:hypothetical protein